MTTSGERTVILDGQGLTLPEVVAVARSRAPVEIDDEARLRCRRSHKVLMKAAAGGQAIYGLNRGVNAFKDHEVSDEDRGRFQRSLLRSHDCGLGPYATEEAVRSIMLVRLNTLLHGNAGCSEGLLDAYADFLNEGIHPRVPLRGSVGEADVTCLGTIGMAFQGHGKVLYQDRTRPAAEALAEGGLRPLELAPGDALRIVSSNALSAGLGTMLIHDTSELLDTADLVYALSLEGLRGHLAPVEKSVQRARPLSGQRTSSRNVRRFLEGSDLHDSDPVSDIQDPLSFRTACHVHGAARAAVGFVRELLELHLNSSEDNPCVIPEEGRVLSSGNFAPPGWVLGFETLGLALGQVARLGCLRQLRLADPAFTGLSRFLAMGEGDFGFIEVQKTFASLEAEIRHLAVPASLGSIPLGEGYEDHALNAPLVVRKTIYILDAVAYIVGLEALHGARAVHLRGPLRQGAGTGPVQARLEHDLPVVTGTEENLAEDVESIHQLVREGTLIEIARDAVAR